ncbi:MAG: hypothetical protein IT350_16710 [Deltaproteobacteria bacterium]|nr:hypothetical protein [Deltaproteobacteria bacterium]
MPRPITGGAVPPGRIIGRDDIIRRMWNTLESQSAILVAERRIGKTCVVRKMEAAPRDGWHPVYFVIEGVRSPAEFASRLVAELSALASVKEYIFANLKDLHGRLGGKSVLNFQLPEFRDHWQNLLMTLLRDLRDNSAERLLLIWDEFPIMVENIAADHGAPKAMQLLDLLRDFRHEDPKGRVRMLFTGSIGLHLVEAALRAKGHKNPSQNDMYAFSLGGLDRDDAIRHARLDLEGLVDGKDIKLGDPIDEVAGALADEADGLPFYMSHAAVKLCDIEGAVRVGDARGAVDRLIRDADDNVSFRHYSDRIEQCYTFHPDASVVATEILNTVARAEKPVSEGDLHDDVSARVRPGTEAEFRKCVEMLVTDHYLVLAEDSPRRYAFKYGLIRRWWRVNRG